MIICGGKEGGLMGKGLKREGMIIGEGREGSVMKKGIEKREDDYWWG